MLTITERLRKHGVVGKFVEFYGPGLEHLTLADRATLGNMCPEYGATIAIFPIDAMTLDYLRLTGRDEATASSWSRPTRGRRACSATRLRPIRSTRRRSTSTCNAIEPSLAGPKRPQDRVPLQEREAELRGRAARR